MKIIIETNNWGKDEKVRKGKIHKELRDTLKRFGYSGKEIDVNVDVREPAAGELNLAYKHGYNKGWTDCLNKGN